MARLATVAEVMAAAESTRTGGEVTQAMVDYAQGVVEVSRLADSSPEELRDWRETR